MRLMMWDTIHSWLKKMIGAIALVCSAAVFVLNVIYRCQVSYGDSEKVIITASLSGSIVMLLLAAAVVYLLCCFCRRIERVNQRRLFWVLSAAYAVLAAYLILNSTPVMRTDALWIQQAAIEVKKGNWSVFKPWKYMHTYPHQLGMLVYDLMLSLITENPALNFAVNALLVLGINHTCWQLSRQLTDDGFVHVLTICLGFAFLPQLFFIMFAYGQIPGFFCLMMAMLQAVRFSKKQSLKTLFGMLVFASLAILLRKNNLIGVLAIACFLVLQFCRQRGWRNALAIICALACLYVPGKAVETVFERLSRQNLNNGCPSVLWLAMGTDIDNQLRGPGWYDSTSYDTYLQLNADAAGASAAGVEKLKVNIGKMQAEPMRALRFFREKTVSQWCEPMYQSVWSGPMALGEQGTYTPLLQNLYAGGSAEDTVEHFCKLLVLLIFGGCMLFLLFDAKKDSGWELGVVYFIGGFLFHMLWEAKSQYIYPYVFSLIPMAAQGIRAVAGRLQERR